MNIEIMFRAWDDEQKKMFMPTFSGIITDKYYGNKFVCELANGECRSCGESSILMMNTGLQDKNGMDIYEGDIIKIESPCLDPALPWKAPKFKRIGWHESGCWNLFESISDEHKGITGITLSNLKYYEVIGNIYEHPELLKQS